MAQQAAARSSLRDSFAGELFGPGQLLDGKQYFIILPDGIGHGGSSKPSDGTRMRFPRYGYHDMARAQHALLTEGLGVDHLFLVMGTSMGGMHTWLWGQLFPDFMDYLVPLASLPAEIAGRNRMMRKMIIDSIQSDPAWNGGEYEEQPPGLISAIHLLIMMTSCPLQWQKEAPTRTAADATLEERIRAHASILDANDMIYQFAASEDYDPAPGLSRIKAPLLAINSADDQVNPPELGIMEAAMTKLKRGATRSCRLTSKRAAMGRIPWRRCGSVTWLCYWLDKQYRTRIRFGSGHRTRAYIYRLRRPLQRDIAPSKARI